MPTTIKPPPKPTKRRRTDPEVITDGSSDGADHELRTSDLKPNPDNPRKITDEELDALRKAMIEFGDLSGLVVNRTTGNMVGGHQRLKILGDAPITITQRYDKPTRQGTVSEGYAEYNGERYVYREVKWDEVRERSAMVAANKHGGEFDEELLRGLLADLNSREGFDMVLTGFSASEVEALFATEEDETERGALLAVLKVSIAEPTHKVEVGQIWRCGNHAVCCLDVMTDWPIWMPELKHESDIFCPYAGPLMLLTENAKKQRLVVVNPDPYVCGLMLDKFVEGGLGTPSHD